MHDGRRFSFDGVCVGVVVRDGSISDRTRSDFLGI